MFISLSSARPATDNFGIYYPTDELISGEPFTNIFWIFPPTNLAAGPISNYSVMDEPDPAIMPL
jgi:hypothetical protein